MHHYGLLNKIGKDQIPLSKVSIAANVIDLIAEVEVSQIYQSTQEKSFEAIYEVL